MGGPNGAGKTTASRGVLRDLVQLGEFINADSIAVGLSGYAPERASFAAGRIMLARLHELADQRADFSFETTMSSRTFVPWLRTLKHSGYEINVVFMWLRPAALAVRRVQNRVRQGGHDVPAEVIKRRYQRGIRNFRSDFMPLAMRWRVYDNSGDSPKLIAFGFGVAAETILDHRTWNQFIKSA